MTNKKKLDQHNRALRCAMCRRRVAGVIDGFCMECGKSYDRARKRDDGTIRAALVWAANRAWRFAGARYRP